MYKKLFLFFFFSMFITSIVYAHSNKFEKDTICHKTGNGYERIVVSPHSIGGHFNGDGTPKESHSEDLLLEGEQESCPNVTPPNPPPPNPPSGGGCSNINIPSNLVVDTGVLNDHTVKLTWGNTQSGTVQINYGWDENNLNQSTSTENDGDFSITGLTNGVHYFFQMYSVNSCGSSGTSEKIDPLP